MSRISITLIALLVFTACSPIKQHPKPDTASMVFYGGYGPAVIVIIDGFPVGSLPFGEVTRFSVAPGEHTFWAKSEGMFGMPATVRLAPGQVSYFGYDTARRSFEQVDAQQFRNRVDMDAERRGAGK